MAMGRPATKRQVDERPEELAIRPLACPISAGESRQQMFVTSQRQIKGWTVFPETEPIGCFVDFEGCATVVHGGQTEVRWYAAKSSWLYESTLVTARRHGMSNRVGRCCHKLHIMENYQDDIRRQWA